MKMIKLINDEEKTIKSGLYALKATGSLEMQWELYDEGFDTIDDGIISGAKSTRVYLPSCNVKIINASSNALYLKMIEASKM